MGEALVSGLIRSGGRTRDELMLTCRREERARELAEQLGVATTLSNPEAVRWASTLVLTVKPQDMEALLGQIGDALTDGHLVITFAAGIRTSFIERFAPPGTPVVRVMSNVAVLVDEAMSVISPGAHAEDKHLAVAEELLTSVGRVIRLPEKHQDAVTAYDHGHPPSGAGRRPGGLLERHRRGMSAQRRAGPGPRTRRTLGGSSKPRRRRGLRGGDQASEERHMGRGDRNKVRWAHDRERKKKEREARKKKDRAPAKKG